MFAQPKFPVRQDRKGTAAIRHTLPDTQFLAQIVRCSDSAIVQLFAEPLLFLIELAPFFLGTDMCFAACKLKQGMAVNRKFTFTSEALVQFIRQFHQIIGVVLVHVQPDMDGNPCIQQTLDICQHHLIGAFAILINKCLAAVINFFRAVQRDLYAFQLPMGNRLFYGSSVKQVSVGDNHGFVHDALFSKVGADDVNDLLIKKRFTAKPMQMDLFAAAMRCNICRCFVGGFVAHGNTGTPQLVAVKAPGVAVRCGKNGIACNMLRFLPHRAADKPYLVGIFHVVHLLRHPKPAVPQFRQGVRRSVFFRRKQQQRPGQGVEHQHAVVHRLCKNIVHPAQALFCRPGLAQYFDCIAGWRQNGLHMRFLYSWFIPW